MIANFVNSTYISQTSPAGQIVFYCSFFDCWFISPVSSAGQECFYPLTLVLTNPVIHDTVMHSQLFCCRIHTDLATCVCSDYSYPFFWFNPFPFGHRNTPIRDSFSFSLSLMGVAYHFRLRGRFYVIFSCLTLWSMTWRPASSVRMSSTVMPAWAIRTRVW